MIELWANLFREGNMGNTTIQIRTDPELKAAADLIFNKLGITMSDGINIFLRQVNMHNGFPFELKLQNSVYAQSQPQRREYIRSLCGKYKNSSFSTTRYFEQKQREKEQEK